MALEVEEDAQLDEMAESSGSILDAGENSNPAGEGETEGAMSWNSSFSSALKESTSGIIDVNGSDDLLWNEIDLAERYLLSSMNEDAASTATTVLQTVSTLMHSTSSGSVADRDSKEEEAEEVVEVGKSEHEEMLECAGMVLLQSYRAIGRVGDFFDILVKLNVGVAEWPLVLVETGACLQIADSAFPAARAALEEFLAVQSTFLPEDTYTELAELFVIKVLVKGLREIEVAMNWVERANLTEENRLAILKKIPMQMERVETAEPASTPETQSTTAIVDHPALTQTSFESESVGKDTEAKESKDVAWEADTCPGANESSMRSKSLALLKRLKVSEGFFSLRTLLELALARLGATTAACQSISAIDLEGRTLRLGALVALSLFLFFRHRHSLRRLFGEPVRALKVGLSDLWQLAFSVQINPLAAVQPIASAY